jgi:hypothetical protein
MASSLFHTDLSKRLEAGRHALRPSLADRQPGHARFMARTHAPRFAAGRWLQGLGGFILLALSAHGQYDPDWARHISVGAMVGFNIKADFQTSGGQFNISKVPGVFDDGFVHPSQNVNGFTANWGYESDSQFNYANQTLLMHNTTSFNSSGRSGNLDAGPLPGLDLAYGGNLWYWKRVRIGWDFGFGLLPINISQSQSGPGTANQSTFTFITGTNNLQPPQAPYHGSASVSGPQILSTPTAVSTGNNIPATIIGTETLDVMLYTLRLGPSIYWDFNRYLGMSVSAGPAIGIVSGDFKFDQDVTANAATAHTSGHVSGTDVVYGGYANTKVMCHIIRNGDIYLGAQYMPLGKATIGGGGNQARLDLEGTVYLSAGINWTF